MKAYILTTLDNHDRKADLTYYPTALPEPELYYGVTPESVEIPDYWKKLYTKMWANDVPERVYCCGKSKELLIRQHRDNYPDEDMLLLEDDVVFTADANERYNQFMADVPTDWRLLYLGGWHEYNCRGCPPIEIKQGVLRCLNVLGNEAVVIRSNLLDTVIDTLTHSKDNVYGHSDWQLVQLQRKYSAYSPLGFVAGQQSGWSNLFQKEREMGIKNDFLYKSLDGKLHIFGNPENNCEHCKNKCSKFQRYKYTVHRII